MIDPRPSVDRADVWALVCLYLRDEFDLDAVGIAQVTFRRASAVRRFLDREPVGSAAVVRHARRLLVVLGHLVGEEDLWPHRWGWHATGAGMGWFCEGCDDFCARPDGPRALGCLVKPTTGLVAGPPGAGAPGG